MHAIRQAFCTLVLSFRYIICVGRLLVVHLLVGYVTLFIVDIGVNSVT